MSLFIVFEGPEGSGKTTQMELLQQALEKAGVATTRTREPGGTPIGEQIRKVLHDRNNREMLPLTEALLYSAARAQHVAEVIRPALDRGEVVICDRYATSTLAYQGYGHGLDLDMLRAITDWATEGLYPDLIVYLDLDVRCGLERKRQALRGGQDGWNRMEEQAIAFHQAVRRGYLCMARSEPARWLIVDASKPVDAVQQQIWQCIKEKLAERRSQG